MNIRIPDLIKVVEVECKKAERAYIQSKKSAQEIAASSSASPSQSGDRFHSQGTADLAKQRFETVSLLKKEIEEKRENICFKHDGKDIYLVDNPILINGFTLVSTKSPLGLKLLNAK